MAPPIADAPTGRCTSRARPSVLPIGLGKRRRKGSGVRTDEEGQKYSAYIDVQREGAASDRKRPLTKQVSLGSYATHDDAAVARLAAEARLGKMQIKLRPSPLLWSKEFDFSMALRSDEHLQEFLDTGRLVPKQRAVAPASDANCCASGAHLLVWFAKQSPPLPPTSAWVGCFVTIHRALSH